MSPSMHGAAACGVSLYVLVTPSGGCHLSYLLWLPVAVEPLLHQESEWGTSFWGGRKREEGRKAERQKEEGRRGEAIGMSRMTNEVISCLHGNLIYTVH